LLDVELVALTLFLRSLALRAWRSSSMGAGFVP